MLQIDICPFASDALEDAMVLAQTKSLNSYTFSDCLNFLNYVWSDIYNQICMIDSGYYSKTVRLTNKLTKLPRFVKNSIMVYSARSQMDYERTIFRAASDTDMTDHQRYRISGTDLYCPDAQYNTVFLEYCPQPAQIFFTHHNRDPKIYPDGHDIERSADYNLWTLIGSVYTPAVPATATTEAVAETDDIKFNASMANTATQEEITACNRWRLQHKNVTADIEDNDLTDYIIKEANDDGQWELKYISCDFPYIFCSYKHNMTNEWKSGFFDKNMEWTDYNPFAWIGRNDNVEYLVCHYNDKTGMGVIVRDWNDADTKLLNIDKLPTIVNSLIYVNNSFEYKAEDGVTRLFTPGYWYNRYATDFNYEQVPSVTAYPTSPDLGDVVYKDNTLYRYVEDTSNPPVRSWQAIDKSNASQVAQKQVSQRVKELGWTPDTRLVYPAPEVYRYLVARLAEKFAALNESNIMGVQSELADARFAFFAFLRKDKSAWERMRNVNPASATDWL